MATPERRGYIDVDAVQSQISVEQVLSFYGVDPGEVHRTAAEIRSRCFLNCGKTQETGNRALAINTAHPAKQWKCHQYECGKSGNLVSLCDLLKDGPSCDGRPRGSRFKEIARDLQAIADGQTAPPATAEPVASGIEGAGRPSSVPATPTRETLPPVEPAEPTVNLPLGKSDKESARKLVTLDAKFLRVPDASMNQFAAKYLRARPYLTPDVMAKWRMGYLPHDAGGDKSGGTMRGKIVYPLLSERGAVLTWFGRDPEFEDKYAKWQAGGRDPNKEPRKHNFVKGFHRGLELFGQQARRLEEPGCREEVAELGIVVVEGPNDVIRLDAMGVPAVGLCSNHITDEQVKKISKWAHALARGTVTVMLDNDPQGENGTKPVLYELSQQCRVRQAWSPTMHDGAFRDRQPESLTDDEWQRIRQTLARV